MGILRRQVEPGPIVIERPLADELSFGALALLVQIEAEPGRDIETIAEWAKEHGLIGVTECLGELVRCGYLKEVANER